MGSARIVIARTAAARWVAAILLPAAILPLATGCSGGGNGNGVAPEKPYLVVEAFDAIDSAGLFIAQQDGLFRAQGLNVKIGFSQSTQQEVNGLEKGTYDIVAGDYVTYIDNELTANARLRIIAESSFLQPHVMAILVGPKSRIGTIASLSGKTISVNATGGVAQMLVDSVLADHGIPRAEVKVTPTGLYMDVPQYLQNGTYDASFTPEPFLTMAEEQANATELTDVDEGSTVNFPIQGVAVTQSWARQYPATLKAFLRALAQGQTIANSSRTAVESAIEKYLEIPSQTARLLSLPAFPSTVDALRLQRVVDTMTRFGLLKPKYGKFNINQMLR